MPAVAYGKVTSKNSARSRLTTRHENFDYGAIIIPRSRILLLVGFGVIAMPICSLRGENSGYPGENRKARSGYDAHTIASVNSRRSTTHHTFGGQAQRRLSNHTGGRYGIAFTLMERHHQSGTRIYRPAR